jgi:hypothetical protein
MVTMDEELSAELLERAGRDQAVRMSLRPGHGMLEWETLGLDQRRAALGLESEAENRARLVAAEG